MRRKSSWYWFLAVGVLGAAAVIAVWFSRSGSRVVLYCAQDRPFAEGLLREFTSRSGIEVAPKFDSEANKSVGLVASIVQEQGQPRCDVFWNNEILSMIRLEKQGLLQVYRSPSANGLEPFPASAVSKTGAWTAFAARARIILVNTELLAEERWPTSLLDLTKDDYRGKAVMAKPTHGTSITQAVCLFEVLGADVARAYYRSLKANDVAIAPGNKDVAVWVGRGETPDGRPALLGVTDTDDAMAEVRAGRPVKILYPDRDGSAKYPRLGTLYIPNAVGIVSGGPNPDKARELVDYLLSEEIEKRLAESKSHQIPFREGLRSVLPAEIEYPPGVTAMEVEFYRAATLWQEALTFTRREFARAD